MHAEATTPPRIGFLAALLRGVIAALLGLIAGAALNMGILYAGMAVFPAPEGVDISRIETINENIHRYSVGQLLVPFLAHALGTLAGAFVAASVAATPHSRRRAALLIGFFFLLGGIDMVVKIPNAPLWFDVLDLGVAYIPMALLGWRLAVRGKGRA
ncbi:MAG: hypothetical protein RL325_1434 [Planctomycetota bacterium]|jgi:hypothetical protein